MRARRAPLLSLALIALLSTAGGAVQAGKTPSAKRIHGWVEWVRMAPEGLKVKAKLDTGAKTSSLHAEHIERFRRDGEKWVRFELVFEDPEDDNRLHRYEMERPLERRIRIKDHEDEGDSRVVVKLPMCFERKVHQVEFSLTDRSEFIYSVLLGRRFLAGRAVVDPDETFLVEPVCPEMIEKGDAPSDQSHDEGAD